MWIKICGTTTLEDAMLAVETGADALGFIFAESPRRIAPEAAGAIAAQLPQKIERYGVFVDASFDAIVSAVETAGLTGVQLHIARDPLLAGKLREYFRSRPLQILHVLHYTPETLETELKTLQEDAAVDAVMIDSRTAHAVGGTGTRFDWHRADEILRHAAPRLRLIVAGGLSPENIREAVAALQPWGVDVVTGVEASPGRKDPEKVRLFIERARAAAASPRAH